MLIALSTNPNIIPAVRQRGARPSTEYAKSVLGEGGALQYAAKVGARISGYAPLTKFSFTHPAAVGISLKHAAPGGSEAVMLIHELVALDRA